MQLTIDSDESKENLRLAASFLLHLAGDLPEVTNGPADETGQVSALLVGRAAAALDAAYPESRVPPPPPPFTSAATAGAPPPPPPPPAPIADATAAASTVAPPAAVVTGAASATAVTADEFDSSGLPWDGRIHQARKGVKKDGTWKIQKGADPALVESVIKELVARKGMAPTPPPAATGSAPPPPPAPPVSLPAGQVSLPLPPVGAASDMSIVIPATAAPVPAPAAPAVGAVSTGYRELIAKCSAATKAGKLDGAKLATIVQRHGCPSVQALRDMPHLIPLVETDVDVELLS